ncbi:MAG: nitroreductase family protein [Candidatus Omnitrophica bacterium]|nr:nitroreductase family protein [Candidatus Omnitrophota bacterium]
MTESQSLYNLIISRRSIRFFQQKEIPIEIVKSAINAGRLAPSAANLQFLEYLVIDQKSLRDKVFSCARWAGYLAPKHNPPANMRPALYIILLVNKKKADNPDSRDIGAAAENILLSLLTFGVGACWLANIDKKLLRRILKIPSFLEVDSLIAAGFPAQAPCLETDSKSVRYWLDESGRLHVPKRPLGDIMHYNKIGLKMYDREAPAQL